MWYTKCLSKTYNAGDRTFYDAITLEDLQDHMACDTTALVEVIANFPMGIKPNFILFLLPLPF